MLALVIAIFGSWIYFQYAFYNEIDKNYYHFLDIEASPRIAFGLAGFTYVIVVLSVLGIIVNSCLGTTATRLHVAVGVLAYLQVLAYAWHNTYTFVSIFPRENTCACDPVTLPLLDQAQTEWLKCYCYLPKEGKVYSFVIPPSQFDDHLTYNLRVQIDHVVYNISTNITGVQFEPEGPADFDPKLSLFEGTEVVQGLDSSELWNDRNLYSLNVFSLLIVTFFSIMLLYFIYQSSHMNIMHNTSLKLINSITLIFVIAVDAFTTVYDIIDSAPIFVHNRLYLIFPLLSCSILLGVVLVRMYLLLSHPEDCTKQSFGNRWPLIIVLLILVAARFFLFYLINDLSFKYENEFATPDYWTSVIIELFVLVEVALTSC